MQLFDKLKLQELSSQSSTETPAALVKPSEIPLAHRKAPHEQSTDRRTSIRDRRRSSQAQGRSTDVQAQGQLGTSGDNPKRRTRTQKEKIDYQKVYTRHIKQVFIRGESILLVHLPT